MNKKTVVVLGPTGQVGRWLMQLAPSAVSVTGLGRSDVDFMSQAAIIEKLDALRPAFVINAAAYTAVDAAETDRDNAWGINARLPETLAEWCAQNQAALIHYSTDFVFDGRREGAYAETDPVAPLNAYGASKLDGETAALAHGATVFRLSWVHGDATKGFSPLMTKLLMTHPVIRAVSDQRSVPTAADEIARATWETIADSDFDPLRYRLRSGLYQMVSTGTASRLDWVRYIQCLLKQNEIDCAEAVLEAKTSDFMKPGVVERPANSVMSPEKFTRTFGITLEPWQSGVERTVKRTLGLGETQMRPDAGA